MSYTAGHHGPDVRNDCWVELTPGSSHIQIESTVKPLYGRRMEEVVRQTLHEVGADGVGARIIDSGAFDWCIRARVLAAASNLPLLLAPKEEGGRGVEVPRPARRSRLYLPGNTPKFFINASLHAADAIILDLEDSVPSDEKLDARFLVCEALKSVDFGPCEKMVRINAGASGIEDLRAVESAGADTILLPKTESPEQIDALNTRVGVIPLIESARGIANADAIAGAKGVVALAIGLEDYLADIGAERGELPYAYGQVVNAARANGIAPLASVWTDLEDSEGLCEEVRRLKRLGFEGVGCLHPSQIPVVHRAFAPSAEELEKARKIVQAFEGSGGAVSVDGKMVDAPVAARARRVLSQGVSASWRLS